jgi:hypothetical protein
MEFTKLRLNLSELNNLGRPLTASLVAWLLALFDDEEMWPKDGTREQFITAVNQTCDYFHQQSLQPKEVKHKQDPRLKELTTVSRPQVVKVYTDYEVLLKEVKISSEHFEFVNSAEESDYLLTFSQVKNFLSIPIHQKVCQFPYESSLIRKVIGFCLYKCNLFTSIL